MTGLMAEAVLARVKWKLIDLNVGLSLKGQSY